jgi:hypothetical protein
VEGVSGSTKPKPITLGGGGSDLGRSHEAGLRALWNVNGDGNIRGPGFAACSKREDNPRSGGEAKAEAGGRRVPATDLGCARGPQPSLNRTRRGNQRVLVFDMWIAYVDQTHLWLVGPAASKDT